MRISLRRTTLALAFTGLIGVIGAVPAAGTTTGRAAPAAPQARAHADFVSPSGNIGCYMYDSKAIAREARCDILQRTFTPPPKPASCPADWGNSLGVFPRGKGRFLCISDSAMGSNNVLGYGQHVRVGRFKCTSRFTGMTCRNLFTGHGFMLAREKYRRF